MCNNARMKIEFKLHNTSPSKMPAKRLAKYITEFSKALGDEEHVHLVEIKEGSLVSGLEIEESNYSEVYKNWERSVNNGLDSIRYMLDEDGCELSAHTECGKFNAYFEGKTKSHGIYKEVSEIHGIIVGLSGTKKEKTIQIRSAVERKIVECKAPFSVAQNLKSELWNSVVLYGVAEKSSDDHGIISFYIDSFEKWGRVSAREALEKIQESGFSLDETNVENIKNQRLQDLNA